MISKIFNIDPTLLSKIILVTNEKLEPISSLI